MRTKHGFSNTGLESAKLRLILFFGTTNVVKYYHSPKKKAETKSDPVCDLREPIPGGTDYNLEDLPKHQPRNTTYGNVTLIHSRTTAASTIKIEEQNHFTSNKESKVSYICSIHEFPHKVLKFYV